MTNVTIPDLCTLTYFDFDIVNFPFLHGDVPRSTSYGLYISQLIRFARASSHVADFNTRNKLLTQKLLKVVRDPCQKITLLLLKSKSVRVIVPESCF